MMLHEIGTVDKVPEFLEQVKEKKRMLMGFGHRIYKNHDPRSRIVKRIADGLFKEMKRDALLDVAIALEKAALEDDYFISRKLYPNVDFYTGVIYKAMGFPMEYMPVLFAVPRFSGWLAHWNEFIQDPDNKIVRPKQLYLGDRSRDFTELNFRNSHNDEFLFAEYIQSQTDTNGRPIKQEVLAKINEEQEEALTMISLRQKWRHESDSNVSRSFITHHPQRAIDKEQSLKASP